MDYIYSTTFRKKGSHLTFEDRQTLEMLVIENEKRPKSKKMTQKEMAEKLGVHPSTISRELKRGKVEQLNTNYEQYTSYSAMTAQDDADHEKTAKGPEIKLGKDKELHDFIEHWILEEKYSPDAVIMKIETEELEFETSICTKTLYNYIDKGYFLRLTNKDLPRQGKQGKRKYNHVRKAHKGKGKSISERPEEANNREEFGHWEMDCVESGKGSRSCLLTLVERKTNFSLNYRLKSQTQSQVINYLDKIERALGRPKFSEIFKSITVDNGSEFLDYESMERSCRAKTKYRTEIYYCHPYSAWERGSNEQMNGQIRRFIKKGSNISEIPSQDIKNLNIWLNNYPKRSLGGQTSGQVFLEELRENEIIGVEEFFFLPAMPLGA